MSVLLPVRRQEIVTVVGAGRAPDNLAVVAPSQRPLSVIAKDAPEFAVNVWDELLHTLPLRDRPEALIVQILPIIAVTLKLLISTVVRLIAVELHTPEIVTVVDRPELIVIAQPAAVGEAASPLAFVVVATAPDALV